MKRSLLLFLFSVSIFQFSFAKANNHVPVNTEDGVAVFPKAKKSIYQTLTLEEMMTLKPREIRERTGEKLSFGERIGLKILRAKYKKALKKAQRRGSQEVGGTDTVSLLSFIFAGAGLLLIWFFGILLALAGLILGIIALADPDRYRRKTGKGFAIAGVAIGGAVFLLYLLAVIATFLFLGSIFG